MKTNAAKSGAEYSQSNELVVAHEPLVKRIAYHLMSRLPASVQADDLIQADHTGLVVVVRTEHGQQFGTPGDGLGVP